MRLRRVVVSQPKQQHQPQGDDQLQIVPLHQKKEDDEHQQDVPGVKAVQGKILQNAPQKVPNPFGDPLQEMTAAPARGGVWDLGLWDGWDPRPEEGCCPGSLAGGEGMSVWGIWSR